MCVKLTPCNACTPFIDCCADDWHSCIDFIMSHTTTIADRAIFFLLVLGIHLAPSQAVCDCGPNWSELECAIEFEGCSAPRSFQNVIPSAPARVWPKYYIEGTNLGLNVTFSAPQENATLARIFDVTVIAMDYPVGFEMCVRVRLDPSTHLKQNQTFSLACVNNPDLIPRQRFNILIQPYPTDMHRSNMVEKIYTMPGCNVIGTLGNRCNNYNHPELWQPSYVRVEPDDCRGLCVRVYFDTYHWPNEQDIDSYRVTICTDHSCPDEYSKLVNCTETLKADIPTCNTTFYGLDPGSYTAKVFIDDYKKGNVYRSGIRKTKFTVEDPMAPIITQMPKDKKFKVQGPNETVTVTWTTPNVSNYIASKVNLTSNFKPGDNFTVGVWTVTYVAEDYYKYRKNEASFKISVIDATATPPPRLPEPKPPQHSASESQKNNQKVIIGGVAGGATALFLILIILFISKSTKLLKKNSDDSSVGGSDGRPSRTPTETTDPTVNEKDNLVGNSQVIHGSYVNDLCPGHLDGSVSPYRTYDDEEFQKVFDERSLDGHVFGPKVIVKCNIIPPGQPTPTPWFTTHVENKPQLQPLQSIEPELDKKEDFKYNRMDSRDSGIGENHDVVSIAQVSFTDEF